jgi:hypothetical protein
LNGDGNQINAANTKSDIYSQLCQRRSSKK